MSAHSRGAIAPLVVLVGVVGVLVVAPLVALVLAEPISSPVSSKASMLEAFTDPVLRSLLLRSGRIAALTALWSVVVGVPVGLLLAMAGDRRTLGLAALHVLPLSLPPQVMAIAFANLAGRRGAVAAFAGEGTVRVVSELLYSETGLVIVLVVSLSPAVTLLTAAFCRSVDPGLLEAGLVARETPAVVARVLVPLAAPGISLGALVVFLMAFSEVAVPQMLRVQVYSTVIFARLSDLSFRPGEALSRAVPLLIVAVLAASAISRLDRGGRSSLGLRSGEPRGFALGSIGWFLRAALVIAATASILPLAALIWSAIGGPGGGLRAFLDAGPALGWSLAFGCGASALMVAIAMPAGYLWALRPAPASLVAMTALIGFVVPRVALGLGTLALWGRSWGGWVSRTELIVIVGLTACSLYVPLRAAKLGFDRVPTSWLEAAALHERSLWRRFTSVLVPASAKTLVTAWLLAFLLAIRDVETVILLRPPGSESLPVRAMTLEVNSPPGVVAATAVLQLVLALAILGAIAIATQTRRPPS